jgi:catechol 2,3-dioxygenase-like lactoylglutathione lyase family enzyme
MLESAMPLLHVSKAQEAVEFYSRLGFRIEYAHGPFVSPASPHADPCYMALSRDNVWIILSSFSGDGVLGGVVNFHLDDVDGLYDEFLAAEIPVEVAPVDQTWGTREMYVRDSDGNSLRFIGQQTAAA